MRVKGPLSACGCVSEHRWHPQNGKRSKGSAIRAGLQPADDLLVAKQKAKNQQKQQQKAKKTTTKKNKKATGRKRDGPAFGSSWFGSSIDRAGAGEPGAGAEGRGGKRSFSSGTRGAIGLSRHPLLHWSWCFLLLLGFYRGASKTQKCLLPCQELLELDHWLDFKACSLFRVSPSQPPPIYARGTGGINLLSVSMFSKSVRKLVSKWLCWTFASVLVFLQNTWL